MYIYIYIYIYTHDISNSTLWALVSAKNSKKILWSLCRQVMSGWFWSDLDVRVIDHIHPWSCCLYPAITNKIKQLVSSKNCWMSFLPTHWVWHLAAFFCWFSQLATGRVFAFFGTNGASIQSAVSNHDSMTMFAALMKASKKAETFLRRPESEVWNTIQKHSEGGPLFSQYCLLRYAKGVVPGLC